MIDWLERVISLLENAQEDHSPSQTNEEECARCYADYYPCVTHKKLGRSLVILRTLREVWIAGTSGEKHV